MKRSYVLAGTLALLAVMFASVGFAAACHVPPAPHEPIEYYPALEIKHNGMIWSFKTTDVDNDLGVPGDFSGLKVIQSSVVAWCWGEDGIVIYVEPTVIVRTKNCVMLIFLPRNLPTAEMIGTTVSGELTNGDTFLSYDGGGFTWGRH
jgi:hypothetical protein